MSGMVLKATEAVKVKKGKCLTDVFSGVERHNIKLLGCG